MAEALEDSMLLFMALPIAAYAFLVVIVRRVLRRSTLPAGWASAAVVGGVLLFAFVAIVTELLSLFTLVRPMPVALGWMGLVALLAVAITKRWFAEAPVEAEASDGATGPALWQGPTGWLWLVVGSIVLFTLVVAIAAPPNTHDALGYHLPRQIRWMDLGRVRHYATNDMRELSFPPLAEYAQMHTLLLTGGDVFVHVPQWLSYALAALAAALGCQALGRPKAGPFAALLVVTIPIFYLQATSPKNDGVLVFLAVTFAWLVIHVLRHPRSGVLECVLLGLVLGCAALTKTTAVLLLFPWCVLVGVGLLVRLRLAAIWRGALIAAVAAVLVAGHTSRNVSSFGHPFGPLADEDGGFGLGMERHDIAAIGSNALRNLGLHAMLASDEDARAVEQFIRDIHTRLGWDPDDLRTTWRRSYFAQAGLDMEGNAPAPVHVVYFFVVAPILVVLLARRRGGMALGAWACVAVGFVLFVSMVKWNEWHTRLHAPMVAMAAIPIAVGFASIGLRWLQVAVVAVASAPAVAVLAWGAAININRPLLGPMGVLSHPRNEGVRWRSSREFEAGKRVEEVLVRLEPGLLSVNAADHEYNVMRLAQLDSDRWTFTGFNPRLGKTDSVDPDWLPSDVHVTAFHVMPVIVMTDRKLERISDAGILNVYQHVEDWPERASEDSLPTMDRYSAIPDLSAAGEMRPAAPYFGTAFGLVVKPEGFAVPVPASEEPRVLLIALHPMHRGGTDVRITLDGGVLLEGPLESMVYNKFAIDVPALPQAGELHIQFPFAQEMNRRFGAAVGWMQMPTKGQIADYDVR
ncbi:MAG: glycosyltransferase family 39 protein [Phycisphaerales bacterium JB060]